ncbi:cytochrome P450 [Roseomonas sp. CCTCC AB2023176]|uniref:cytochrome P450 n=1 Tax=Roseomonas sp. CCTCC AB2023176 TaxID=3342640 RepID=UPI0035DCD42A
MAWEGGTMRAGTGVLILAPFFHRDRERLAQADQFLPEAWLEADPPDPGFMPFSGGPAACPGRDLVLTVGSAMIGALLSHVEGLERPTLSEGAPLPAQLNPFALRFRLCGDARPRPARVAQAGAV